MTGAAPRSRVAVLTALRHSGELTQVEIGAATGLTAGTVSTVVSGLIDDRLVRVRDVMPGYRSGVRDELRLRVIPAPARTALQRLDPQALTWFEETVQPPPGVRFAGLGADTLPPAKYAVDLSHGKATVVYSEQCLSPDFCFTWQRWSAAMQQAAAPAATR